MKAMIPLISGKTARIAGIASAMALVLLASACSPPPATSTIPDPLEDVNRGLFKVNIGFDKTVLVPISNAMGTDGREGYFGALANFAGNIDTAGYVVNDLLQLNIHDAVQNTLRFGVNTVFGLGGVLDPATDMGLASKPTDFGATMYTYGVDEGVYVVLPFYGPSTSRDAVGLAVDRVINPLNLVLTTPVLWAGTIAHLAGDFGSRMRHSETVDSILYDSADGYAQARLLYLQYRQFELGQTPADADFIDPYEDQ